MKFADGVADHAESGLPPLGGSGLKFGVRAARRALGAVSPRLGGVG